MGTQFLVKWGPSLAEMGTKKHTLDKLTEMSRLPEIERKTSISVKHMQVFEYLTTNCLLARDQMVYVK